MCSFDVVDVNIEHDGSQIHLDSRHPQALVVLFTTGSAIGEATHVRVNVASPSVSVVSGGTLTVTAEDDYGDPASNASITLSGHGNGNSRVASDFSAPTATVLTNGRATIALTDHRAEAVTITYRVKDATYTGTVDTTSGQAMETFTPGPTAAIHDDLLSTVTVGTTTHVHGDAEDAFGNAIQDGTSIAVAAKTGAISNLTPTSNGDFAFDYTAPKAKGDDELTLTAADSSYVATGSVHNQADHPFSATPTVQTSTVGQQTTLRFQLLDEYGNLVEDGQSISLNLGDGSPAQTLTTLAGQVSATVTPSTKAQTYQGSLIVASNAAEIPFSFNVAPGAAAKITLTAGSSSITAGTADTITGTVVDAYNNPVADGTVVGLSASAGLVPSQVLTSGGQFTFDLTQDTKVGTDGLSASTNSGVAANANVTVTPATAANINLTPATSNVVAGQADVFTGTVTDTYGNVVSDGTVVTLTSSTGSSSTDVKTSGGQFTFTPTDDTKAGTFTLTARAGDSASQNASVTVTPGAASNITLTAASPSVVAGTSDTFRGTVLDAYGNKVADGTAVTFTSSANLPPMQVITSDGQFAYTPTDDTQLGSYTLTASVSSTLSASASVNVTPGQTARIQLNGPTSLTVGSMGVTYTGVAVDAYGNTVVDGTTFTVTSQQGTVASVTASLGGSFSFQYSAPTKTGNDVLVIQAGGSAYSTSSTVTLTAAAPASLTLNLPSGIAGNTVPTDPFYAPAGYSFTGTLAGGSDSIVPAPTTVAVSGTLIDKYGNLVANTPLNYAQALTGTLTTDANGNYSGTLNVNAAGAVSATVNNQSLPIVVNGVTVTSIAPTGLQLHYRTGYLGMQVENGVSQTFTATATTSQSKTFNWALHGFVGWSATHETLRMFVNGPAGTQWYTLSDATNVGGGFSASGTLTVTLNQGSTYGFVLYGSTYELNDYFAGTLTLTPGN